MAERAKCSATNPGRGQTDESGVHLAERPSVADDDMDEVTQVEPWRERQLSAARRCSAHEEVALSLARSGRVEHTRRMVRDIGASPQWKIEHEEERRLLVVRRTAEPWPSEPTFPTSLWGLNLVARAAGIDPRRTLLLVDLREGPMRNDDTFERAITEARRRFETDMRAYSRAAFLVRTAVGRLQVQRYAREDGADFKVFDDEPAALAFLFAG